MTTTQANSKEIQYLHGLKNTNIKAASYFDETHSKKFFCSSPETATHLNEDTEQDELFRQITVEVKGHDPAVMRSYEQFVTMAANELDINISRSFTPPKVITRFTLLKSVHVHKKKRVQYEQRTHYKVIEMKYLTGSTADTFLEYIERNLPEGMAMKVTKHRLEVIPEHMKAPKQEGESLEWSVDSVLGPVVTKSKTS